MSTLETDDPREHRLARAQHLEVRLATQRGLDGALHQDAGVAVPARGEGGGDPADPAILAVVQKAQRREHASGLGVRPRCVPVEQVEQGLLHDGGAGQDGAAVGVQPHLEAVAPPPDHPQPTREPGRRGGRRPAAEPDQRQR